MADYSQPSFNISIEEEYQFIDPDSRELRGFATAQGLTLLHDQAWGEDNGGRKESAQSGPSTGSPDLASTPVTGTPICRDIKQARQELLRIRREMRQLAANHGLKMIVAGAHPLQLLG